MKALTISQPFASLIADGEKWIENRRWPTKYRGPLAIHAGKGLQYLDKQEILEYPTGCVIAVARLVSCLSLSQVEAMVKSSRGSHMIPGSSSLSWIQVLGHRHAEGPFCWVLEDVKKIEPVTVNGKQGLWDWDCGKIAV